MFLCSSFIGCLYVVVWFYPDWWCLLYLFRFGFNLMDVMPWGFCVLWCLMFMICLMVCWLVCFLLFRFIFVCLFVCLCVWLCVCLCVCTYVCLCVSVIVSVWFVFANFCLLAYVYVVCLLTCCQIVWVIMCFSPNAHLHFHHVFLLPCWVFWFIRDIQCHILESHRSHFAYSKCVTMVCSKAVLFKVKPSVPAISRWTTCGSAARYFLLLGHASTYVFFLNAGKLGLKVFKH